METEIERAEFLTSLDIAEVSIDAGECEEYTSESLTVLVESIKLRGIARLFGQGAADQEQMAHPEHQMALRSYGYGRWDAPFWFIGPEQGQARAENDTLSRRVEAWQRLGGNELCDCREFHDLIEEHRWHGQPTRLQSTWKSLILLLLTSRGVPTNDAHDEIRRSYQRERWGRVNTGETCVIELSGLPANNLGEQRNREQFRSHRIETIRHRINDHKPQFVHLYGKSEYEHWCEIAKCTLELDRPHKIGSTIFLYTLHPNAHGLTKQHWIELGSKLRSAAFPNI